MLTLVATLLLSKAAFGRHLYALGTSATVAEFSGVPTARTTVLTYVISGLTAALAGMLLTGYSGQAYLGMGDAYLFTSIAAVAIGGASILGGSGHYLGTVAGALVLTILTGLLPALNLSSGALLIVYGAVILITVSIGSEMFAGIGGRLRKTRARRRPRMVEITCVVDARAELGEGTLWDPKAGVLWWIDIWQKHIHRYDPATGKDEIFEAPEYLGCLGLREKGGLVLTMASGFYFFDPATGVFEPIVDPEAHMPQTRFNDGKPDRQGRFWSGTMFEVPGKPIEFVGALYRMDADLSVHKMIDGVGCCNGLAFSPDSRTMYFSDSHSGRVDAYDFDPATGDIENRRTFIDMTVTGGVADGATVDAEGCYWVTIPVTSKVCRYDPDGRADADRGAADRPADLLRVRRQGSRHPLRHVRRAEAPGRAFRRTEESGRTVSPSMSA